VHLCFGPHLSAHRLWLHVVQWCFRDALWFLNSTASTTEAMMHGYSGNDGTYVENKSGQADYGLGQSTSWSGLCQGTQLEWIK
jgi:hypothetical protein